MKYVFLRLRDRLGEIEHYSDSVEALEDGTDINAWAREQAMMAWAEDEYDEEKEEWRQVPGKTWEGFGGNVFFSPSGEVATEVSTVREISKEHFDVLKEYL